MVMVSRSAFKRSSDTWSSDVYNIVPPWCSSGRGNCNRDTYIQPVRPSGGSVWDYHNDVNINGSNAKCIKRTLIKRSGSRRVLLTTCVGLSLIIAFLLSCDTQKKHFITYLSKSETLSIQKSIAVEECSNRMSALTLELHRAERALRNTLRVRKAMFSQNIIKEPAIQYISGGKVVQGSATTEWRGSVALWGAVRLWRTAPPPDTVLSVRPPAPADCWPFRGSYGEMIIQLPRRYLVERVSLEHVRPDTARSAPKRFTLHGILDNGTWVKSVEAEYVHDKPPKQYFVLCTKSVPLQRLVLRVLSNHGNTRYTCVYRVHLYTKLTQH